MPEKIQAGASGDSKPPLMMEFSPTAGVLPGTRDRSSRKTSPPRLSKKIDRREPPTFALKLKKRHPEPSDQSLTRALSAVASMSWSDGPEPSAAVGQGVAAS